MKKKLALIVISLDECLSESGFSGGGHKVTANLISGIIQSELYDIDIFCKKSKVESLNGINSIKVLSKKDFVKKLSDELSKESYEYILSSDILLPFGNLIIHSNSAKYKCKNGKNKLQENFLKIYNLCKIKKQQKCFSQNDKHFFTVSNSLKNDYAENYSIDANRIFVSYPATDGVFSTEQKQNVRFTVGTMAGGGLNKGGYLFLFALENFIKEFKIKPEKFKARIIFPKMHKSFFYKLLIKCLKLEAYVELLPKQSDMNKFYSSIDCYVLPSLNEAFGLVVTEAGSCSRPSLVSSTTGVRELIKDGENGFVFERTKNPVKNLSEALYGIYSMYFYDYENFCKIGNNACETAKALDWQKFTDTIIKNMKEEKSDKEMPVS